MMQSIWLNLGCGKTHLPSAPPPGHELVDPDVYAEPHWINIDRVEGVGADLIFNLFEYPWPLESNLASGALLSHIIEHIPHEIRLTDRRLTEEERQRWEALEKLQDGWYAFFSELWRVLKPGAVAHIVCPHGHSDGALADPTHTRYIMPQTFTHGLQNPDSKTFRYETGCVFELTHPIVYRFTELAASFFDDPHKLQHAMMTQINIVYDMYARLKAVKDQAE